MYYKLLHSFHFNVTLILRALRCITGWNETMGPQQWNGLARMHQAKLSLLIKHVPKKGTYLITCPTKDATNAISGLVALQVKMPISYTLPFMQIQGRLLERFSQSSLCKGRDSDKKISMMPVSTFLAQIFGESMTFDSCFV
jgi:hypothetical protein